MGNRDPKARVAAAVGVSVVINGILLLGMLRLVSERASAREVRLAVQLEPYRAAVALPHVPRRNGPVITRPPTPAPVTRPAMASKAAKSPVRGTAKRLFYHRVPEPVPGMTQHGGSSPATFVAREPGVHDGTGNPIENVVAPSVAADGPVTALGTAEQGSSSGNEAKDTGSENPGRIHREDAKPPQVHKAAPTPPAASPTIARGERRGARAVKAPQPPYPRDARADGAEGTVVLSVSIDARATVTSVEIVESSGDGRLDRAARRAVGAWSFEPGLDDGKPVASVVRVRVKFSLE